MVKTDSVAKNRRISFSHRIFWSILAIFLAFISCFLIFQYQRERDFSQEKLHAVLNTYNYQLYKLCSDQTNDIDSIVA